MVIDAYAIIVQRDLDGGDSLHREAMYAFGSYLRYDRLQNKVIVSPAPSERPSPSETISKFEISPGIYVRHPDPKKWYSNPETTSRDQLTPVIAYCAAYEDYPRLLRLFEEVAKRGMFAQNVYRNWDDGVAQGWKIPDPMHLNTADFIRAGGWWTAPLYPALLVFDSLDLVGTVISLLPLHWKDDHLFPRWREEGDVDDNNTIVKHLLAAEYKPTPFSALNRYVYSTFRGRNLGNSVLGEHNPVMGSLAWYHRNTHGGEGNPEMAELYRPLVEEYFTYPALNEIVLQTITSLRERWVSLSARGKKAYNHTVTLNLQSEPAH